MPFWQSLDSSSSGWRSSKAFIYIVVNSAVFTDAYLYGLIIPVLPFALTDVIKVHKDDVQWWIGGLLAAYGFGLLIGAPIVGHYADRMGSRRVPYLVGLGFLALSTIAISLGRSMWILILGRLIQGASSASVHAVGVAILADTVGDNGIGAAMGLITMMMALGAVLGPVVGGSLYHSLGYFAVFLSAYILVAVDFILRFLMVETRSGDETAAISTVAQDYGTLLPTSTSQKPFPLDTDQAQDAAGLTESPSRSATPPAAVVCTRQLLTEKTSFRHPIIELLCTPRMLAAILGDFVQSFILTGLETILPLRIKTVFHYNSKEVAFVYLLLGIPYAAGPLIGKIADVYGPKVVVSGGFAALMPLMIMLRLVDHCEADQVALLCVLLICIGTALNMILTPVYSDTMYLVDEKAKKQPGIFGDSGAYAQAFALMNMAYAVGSVMGPLMGGWLLEIVGFNSVSLGAGILGGFCIIPCIMYTGGKTPKKAAGNETNETM